jgi:prevent-host-death family protein
MRESGVREEAAIGLFAWSALVRFRHSWHYSVLVEGTAMRESRPSMQTMKISDVKQQLNSLVNRVYHQETRILIEKSGIPVAGIVSVQDLRRLDQLDRERAERFKILDEIGDAFKDVPAEELEREVAKALAEARAELRSERELEVGVKT